MRQTGHQRTENLDTYIRSAAVLLDDSAICLRLDREPPDQ
jgi:hypothetical protein